MNWDATKFGFGQADAPLRPHERDGGGQGGSGSSAKFIEKASNAIASPWFWGYCAMVGLLAGFCADLSGWAEGCACHEEEHGAPGARSYHLRKQQFQGCHCKGRRAPELAAGVLTTRIDMLQSASVSKLAELTTGLSETDRLSVFADWTCACDPRLIEAYAAL